ncbi:MAG: protein kinase [Isosphaerales bacterium]
MPETDLTSGADRNPIEMLAEEFVERQRRGELPSLSEYTRKYPELADAIADLFPALLVMERVKPVAEGRPASGGPDASSLTDLVRHARSRLGDFRILREVARGGMGVVYEAVQESLGRHVALKILPLTGRLSSTQLQRFKLEACSAGRLHHGNIVPVYGVGEHEGVHYYAMQFIHGHGMDAIVDDLRRLRGLADGKLASRSEEPTASSAVPSGSMDLARSLVAGAFANAGLDGHALASTASAAPASSIDATIRDAGLPPAEHTCDVLSLSAQPETAAAGSDAIDTSSASLGTESQFYRSVARIGAQVADALAYAHRQGVLHRDIKPSNLLLDVAGRVWVTDFGLAKVEGSEGPTRTGDIVGTVRYMPPERFDGWSDHRSDVYSLGATLYELLTLHPLFGATRQSELIEKVLHDSPEAPRKLDPKIPRDLETIVLKAIAKEPGDRYATAQALGEDLARFLEDRTILARRSTTVEQCWRWCRRNPWLAGANITAAVLTTLLAIGSTIAAWTFRDQRNTIRQALSQVKQSEAQERRARIEAREQLFQALYDRARAQRFSRQAGQRFDGLAALDQAAAIARDLKLPPARLDPLRDEAIACLALPDLRPEPGGRIIRRPRGTELVAFDPTMTRYALRFTDGTIRVHRVADDEEVARFHAQGDRDVAVFGFSPDGRYLATSHYPGYALTVWDIARRAVALNDPGPVSWRHATRFSPDSRRIAVAHGDGAVLYDLATGQPSQRWRGPTPAHDLDFRGDGARIAILYQEKTPTCQILETETGRLVRSIALPIAGDWVAWSPDGTTLATACDRTIHLWDAATGNRRATLEGHTNGGVRSGFHPAGTLLASNGWDSRLRLWDPILGRSWPSAPGDSVIPGHFSRDGRIVLSLGERLTPYQVEPALEFRTLLSVSTGPSLFEGLSIRHDGRILAAGTRQGVVLWDLASGAEVGFLTIGNTPQLTFEASGELLTSGAIGVRRWPVRLDLLRGEFRLGPPRTLPLASGYFALAADRLGRVVALADIDCAHVCTPDRVFQLRSLDDVRSVAVSPDGEWIATGSHGHNGAQVWRVRDAMRVKELAIDGVVQVQFSPDGKWLMNTNSPCRLWEVGTWREGREIGGEGLCFTPDGQMLLVRDPDKILRLVETETGNTIARLTSPDLGDVWGATFSPDGSRLVMNNRAAHAVQEWDLRAIREHLDRMGLDWNSPAYSDDDPARSSAPKLPPLQVDYGSLADELEIVNEPSEVVLERHTARLKRDPDDAHAYHLRAHALAKLRRFPEAIEAFTNAIRLRPMDAHVRAVRGIVHLELGQKQPAIDDLEAALKLDPDQRLFPKWLSEVCTARAWELATGPEQGRDLDRALPLARRAVELSPWDPVCVSTLGVTLYRAGRYAESITILERSLDAGRGETEACDLVFLAMAHHRLGHADLGRAWLERAARWMQNHPDPYARRPGERAAFGERRGGQLAAFRAEAEAVLAGPRAGLPDDVFADPR